MAYDETLASRIDELLKNKKNFTKKKMFGGVGYMFNGNMCIGVHKNEFIVRCKPEETDQMLTQKNVRLFDISGKPMKGWLLISPEGMKDAALQNWLHHSLEYVQTLPKK
jgi:TfoX N-terminal domain